MLQKLQLHDLVLPGLELAARGEEKQYFEEWKRVGLNGTLFDARKIDPSFLDDTGEAAIEELKATKGIVRLPFATCAFEFSDWTTMLAQEVEEFDVNENLLGTSIEFYVCGTYPNGGDDEFPAMPRDEFLSEYADGLTVGHNSITNWIDWEQDGDPTFLGMHIEHGTFVNDFGEAPMVEIDADKGATRLVGLLTLLNEHLIATEVVADQCPALNAKRAKKGKLPLSAETRVLTINTAAVRRAVRGTQLRQHESPRLHWRRGHWRTLHRFSEFESRTWVRRCLVGDPERGVVHKDYRLVWEQPMVAAN